jgi:4-carboxymuconolactone decarboxylase
LTDDRYERGMKARRQVLGDEHVDRAAARETALTRDFQEFITGSAWGDVWARPGLDRRTRSCITITALMATNRPEELEMHLHAALRNGVTAEEIGEVILHNAIYCGIPAANSAFAIAQDVLEGGRKE